MAGHSRPSPTGLRLPLAPGRAGHDRVNLQAKTLVWGWFHDRHRVPGAGWGYQKTSQVGTTGDRPYEIVRALDQGRGLRTWFEQDHRGFGPANGQSAAIPGRGSRGLQDLLARSIESGNPGVSSEHTGSRCHIPEDQDQYPIAGSDTAEPNADLQIRGGATRDPGGVRSRRRGRECLRRTGWRRLRGRSRARHRCVPGLSGQWAAATHQGRRGKGRRNCCQRHGCQSAPAHRQLPWPISPLPTDGGGPRFP
jgi:hypothetical protein